MRRWVGPILLAVLLGGASFYVAVLAMPRVLMAVAVTRVTSNSGGINRMVFPPLATENSRTVVRPSPDLAYSVCAFDVSAGAVIVTAAPVATPYWSLAVYDAETNTVFTRNNRQSANRAVRIAIAMPGQPVPAGVAAVRVHQPRGIALIRALVVDRAGFAPLDRARRVSACAAA